MHQTLREPLYALACTANNVSVSGVTRDVITFDTHKWNIRARWNSCLKYEVTSLHLSSENENLCYVSGLGSEVSNTYMCINALSTCSTYQRYIG